MYHSIISLLDLRGVRRPFVSANQNEMTCGTD